MVQTFTVNLPFVCQTPTRYCVIEKPEPNTQKVLRPAGEWYAVNWCWAVRGHSLRGKILEEGATQGKGATGNCLQAPRKSLADS